MHNAEASVNEKHFSPFHLKNYIETAESKYREQIATLSAKKMQEGEDWKRKQAKVEVVRAFTS